MDSRVRGRPHARGEPQACRPLSGLWPHSVLQGKEQRGARGPGVPVAPSTPWGRASGWGGVHGGPALTPPTLPPCKASAGGGRVLVAVVAGTGIQGQRLEGLDTASPQRRHHVSSVPPCTELGPGPTVAKTGRRLRVTLARSDAPRTAECTRAARGRLGTCAAAPGPSRAPPRGPASCWSQGRAGHPASPAALTRGATYALTLPLAHRPAAGAPGPEGAASTQPPPAGSGRPAEE